MWPDVGVDLSENNAAVIRGDHGLSSRHRDALQTAVTPGLALSISAWPVRKIRMSPGG